MYVLHHFIDGEDTPETFTKLDEVEPLLDPDGILNHLYGHISTRVSFALHHLGVPIMLDKNEFFVIQKGP